jgi:hypothetical protein
VEVSRFSLKEAHERHDLRGHGVRVAMPLGK